MTRRNSTAFDERRNVARWLGRRTPSTRPANAVERRDAGIETGGEAVAEQLLADGGGAAGRWERATSARPTAAGPAVCKTWRYWPTRKCVFPHRAGPSENGDVMGHCL